MDYFTYKIKSRKLGKTVTFGNYGTRYIWCNLNGKEGTLGIQPTIKGATMTVPNNCDQAGFNRICRNWWRDYVKNI